MVPTSREDLGKRKGFLCLPAVSLSLRWKVKQVSALCAYPVPSFWETVQVLLIHGSRPCILDHVPAKWVVREVHPLTHLYWRAVYTLLLLSNPLYAEHCPSLCHGHLSICSCAQTHCCQLVLVRKWHHQVCVEIPQTASSMVGNLWLSGVWHCKHTRALINVPVSIVSSPVEASVTDHVRSCWISNNGGSLKDGGGLFEFSWPHTTCPAQQLPHSQSSSLDQSVGVLVHHIWRIIPGEELWE